MSYNSTSVSIRPLSVSISYHVASNGYYYADGYEPTQVFTRDADALVVVREFEQAHICNPTPGINYVGGFYPAWPINNPFVGLEGDVDYSVGRNGVALWSFYTWEQDGEDQVASHCVHFVQVDGVSTVTIGDIALGYACAVEVREVVDTTVVTLAEALEVAELEADEAAMYANTDEVEVTGALVLSPAGALTIVKVVEVDTLVEVTAEVLEVYSVLHTMQAEVLVEDVVGEEVLEMEVGGHYFLAVEENRQLVQAILAQQEEEVQRKVRWAKAEAEARIEYAERRAEAEAKAEAAARVEAARLLVVYNSPRGIAGKQSKEAAEVWVIEVKALIKAIGDAYKDEETGFETWTDEQLQVAGDNIDAAYHELSIAEAEVAKYS